MSNAVELFTYYRDLIQEHTIERLMPDGAAHLIIELDDIPKFTFHNETLEVKEKYSGGWISGMQKEFISISAEVHSSMFVIRFTPTGLFQLLGVSMDELRDQVFDAELFFGSSIRTLRDQLLEAPTPECKFKAVSNWLSEKMISNQQINPVVNFAIDHITKNPSLDQVGRLSQITGYSQKQLIHLFKTHLGLTPKYFQRIMRFNLVLKELDQTSRINWTALSQQCGFYDQAHFIREFQKFSGFNPTEFLNTEREYKNYVVVA
ncbi:MAG: AraC family transcriptional regulator [Balneolaceae bacterium]|nr:AraC family transcriptional regulator [Balneolaceae bacterium]MBO6646865.1 AraC family transcriptional regulator [Balneolaceae bacterium]